MRTRLKEAVYVVTDIYESSERLRQSEQSRRLAWQLLQEIRQVLEILGDHLHFGLDRVLCAKRRMGIQTDEQELVPTEERLYRPEDAARYLPG
jgi:hypothetical protein